MGQMVMLSGSTEACPLVILTKNDPDPPLYPYIGNAHWHVPWGQDYFDQGLRFLFAFNNRESYRAFRQAAREAEDRGIPCSACYWAQALPLGVDINMAEQLEKDRVAANTALQRAMGANPNPEDMAMIWALFGRYQNCNPKQEEGKEKECQKIRNRDYYIGMKKVLELYGGDDPNVITLFADSAMNLAPWLYWDSKGNPVVDEITEARTNLEKALKFLQYPENEGPIHWYIHLMEQSPMPDVAKPYADLLAPLAPNAGHLVHMPSHIYYRVGDMQKAIKANKEAIEADDAYFATEPDLYRPDGDRYKYGYYPHNINLLLAAAALSGDDNDHDINRYAETLLNAAPDRANGYRADLYRTVYYLAKVNFSSTTDIRKFEPPNRFEDQPYANVAYDYTQLMADIWDGKDSKQSAEKLDVDVATYRKSSDEPNASCDLSAPRRHGQPCLVAILGDLGHARRDASKGMWKEALDAATDAIKIQGDMRYNEPPLWLYPARQTKAAILIRKADAEDPTHSDHDALSEAKQLLQSSLNEPPVGDPNLIPTSTFPGNGWAYYGLLEIAKRDGSSPDQIDRATKDLNNHWFGDGEFHTLDRL